LKKRRLKEYAAGRQQYEKRLGVEGGAGNKDCHGKNGGLPKGNFRYGKKRGKGGGSMGRFLKNNFERK